MNFIIEKEGELTKEELLEEAKRYGIRIPEEGIEVTRQLTGEKDTVKPFSAEKVEELKGTYARNNGVVCFVDSEGNTYVAPDSPELIAKLEECGMVRNYNMYVPLSNGEIINGEGMAEEWKEKRANSEIYNNRAHEDEER